MKKPYYKELPLFHIYDSNLTGSQKLLMTPLLIDDTYDIYTLSCLAKLRTEDVILDLKELKKHADEFGLEHDNHIMSRLGKRVNGFWGIEALVTPPIL